MHRELKTTIVNNINFHGPIGNYQYIEHVDNYHHYKDGEYVEAEEVKGERVKNLQEVVWLSMSEGLWWASTAWAVVYRIYQMKGYKGNISQFILAVSQWVWNKEPDFACTYDAIQKPIASGKMIGNIEKWQGNGATEQMIRLGNYLLEHLK